jgi:hypothetical protein
MVLVGRLGHICVSFMPQTESAWAIITGFFRLQSSMDLGNKTSILHTLLSKKGELHPLKGEIPMTLKLTFGRLKDLGAISLEGVSPEILPSLADVGLYKIYHEK